MWVFPCLPVPLPHSGVETDTSHWNSCRHFVADVRSPDTFSRRKHRTFSFESYWIWGLPLSCHPDLLNQIRLEMDVWVCVCVCAEGRDSYCFFLNLSSYASACESQSARRSTLMRCCAPADNAPRLDVCHSCYSSFFFLHICLSRWRGFSVSTFRFFSPKPQNVLNPHEPRRYLFFTSYFCQ